MMGASNGGVRSLRSARMVSTAKPFFVYQLADCKESNRRELREHKSH